MGFKTGTALIFVVSAVALGLFMFVCFGVINRISFPGQQVEIEQVRYAMERVKPNSSEDIYGQAVAMNRMIASNQRYNDMTIIGIIIPNGWDSIELIDIPEE